MGADPFVRPLLASISGVQAAISITLVLIIAVILLISITLSLLLTLGLFYYTFLRPKFPGRKDGQKIIGFFHPYCNAGGGGERVLWVAIKAMKVRFPSAKYVIYTGDLDAAPDQIVAKARDRFNVQIAAEDVEFVYLHRRKWVEAEMYPYFTLLGQSLGSIFLGVEALNSGAPDIFIDTMGYAFTLPLFKFFGGCKTACYVHYPTISTDMLDKVRTGRRGFNNRPIISNSWILTSLKLVYYHFFTFLYRMSGMCADVVMVNSSWTEMHITQLWSCAGSVQRIYPPCDVNQFKEIERQHQNLKGIKKIVSVAQFRPEKDHPLQIRALARLRDIIFQDPDLNEEQREQKWKEIQLILIGGCRNAEDEARVKDLKNLSNHLAVEKNVQFKTNLSFEELKKEMGEGIVGLHTMWNEHFGIAVVEMMAAGLVTLAHRSGGPLMDIVVETPVLNQTGFLAITEEEYAEAILEICDMSEETREGIRERAVSSVQRFSELEFEKSWVRATENLVNSTN